MGDEFGKKNQTVFVANKTRDNVDVICFSSDNEASDYCFQDSKGEYYIRCVLNQGKIPNVWFRRTVSVTVMIYLANEKQRLCVAAEP